MLKKTVSYVVEKLLEYGILCLLCSYTNDVKMTSSGRHSAKGLSEAFDNSVVAIVTDI